MNKNIANYVASKDGTKIGYDVSGSGPVLIMIMGASCFSKFAPVFDLRGRGDS